jgi:hypothetical protein
LHLLDAINSRDKHSEENPRPQHWGCSPVPFSADGNMTIADTGRELALPPAYMWMVPRELEGRRPFQPRSRLEVLKQVPMGTPFPLVDLANGAPAHMWLVLREPRAGDPLGLEEALVVLKQVSMGTLPTTGNSHTSALSLRITLV